MDINEIAKDIIKNEDNQLARAFTMTIGKMLVSNGIHPIVIKSPENWVTDDDTSLGSYIIRKEYNVTFDIDTTEHDKEVRADAIDEFAGLLIKRCWSKMGDLEYVSEEEIDKIRKQLKERNK